MCWRSTVVDHIVRHGVAQARTEDERRAALKRFWDRKNWQGLCASPCHNRAKQAEERRGDPLGGIISASALESARQHARREYPREACGLVVGNDYWPCRNEAADPLNYFEIAPHIFIKADATGELRALVHSHPNGTAEPSQADRMAQSSTALPWIIISINATSITNCTVFGQGTK